MTARAVAADPTTEPRGDAAAPAVPGGRRAAMRFILIAVLIDMMSIGLIIPVLPALVGGFTGNATDAAAGRTARAPGTRPDGGPRA